MVQSPPPPLLASSTGTDTTGTAAAAGHLGTVPPPRTVRQTARLVRRMNLACAPLLDDIYYMSYEAYLRHVRCQSIFYGRAMTVEPGSRPGWCVVRCRCTSCPFRRRTREFSAGGDGSDEPLQVVTYHEPHACHPIDHLDHPLVVGGDSDSDDNGTALVADLLVKLVEVDSVDDRNRQQQRRRQRRQRRRRNGATSRPGGGDDDAAATGLRREEEDEDEEAAASRWSMEALTRAMLEAYGLDCSSPGRQRELLAGRAVALRRQQERQQPNGAAERGGGGGGGGAVTDSDQSLQEEEEAPAVDARESGDEEGDLESPPSGELEEEQQQHHHHHEENRHLVAAAALDSSAASGAAGAAATAPEVRNSPSILHAFLNATCVPALFERARAAVAASPGHGGGGRASWSVPRFRPAEPAVRGVGGEEGGGGRADLSPSAAKAAVAAETSDSDDDENDGGCKAAIHFDSDDEEGCRKPAARDTAPASVAASTNTTTDSRADDDDDDASDSSVLESAMDTTGMDEPSSHGLAHQNDDDQNDDDSHETSTLIDSDPDPRRSRRTDRVVRQPDGNAKTRGEVGKSEGTSEHRVKLVPSWVEQYDLKSGRVIGVYESVKAAAQQTRIKANSISPAASGARFAGGYGWRRIPPPAEPPSLSLSSSKQFAVHVERRTLHAPSDAAAGRAPRVSKHSAGRDRTGRSAGQAMADSGDGPPRRTSRVRHTPTQIYEPAPFFHMSQKVEQDPGTSRTVDDSSDGVKVAAGGILRDRFVSVDGNSSASVANRIRTAAALSAKPTTSGVRRSTSKSGCPKRSVDGKPVIELPTTSRRPKGCLDADVREKRKKRKLAVTEIEACRRAKSASCVAGGVLEVPILRAERDALLPSAKCRLSHPLRPMEGFRVVSEDRTICSLGLDLDGISYAVHETGPWYEAGSGPASRSRYSSYPFMFQPTLQALADEYNELSAQGFCIPARLNAETVMTLKESIDAKLVALAKFDFHQDLLADIDDEERDYKISLRHFTRSEEQERLARYNEDAAYNNQRLLLDSLGPDRKSLVNEQEREVFESSPVLFDSTASIFEEDCDRADCSICTGDKVAVPCAGHKPRRKIPMPLYRRVESIDIVGDDYAAYESGIQGDTLRKARNSISKLRQIRNSTQFVACFPENPVTKFRREVRAEMMMLSP